MIRKDLDRLLEVQFLQETQILKHSNSLQEFYSRTSTDILEFLNPTKSYGYDVVEVGDGYLYKVEKIGNDPQFVVTLKKNGSNHVLDFYWPESEKGFERIPGLQGTNYLDTLVNILQVEILPMLESGKLSHIMFAPYQIDSAGELRNKVFSRIVEKFVDSQKFTILKTQDYTVIGRKYD